MRDRFALPRQGEEVATAQSQQRPRPSFAKPAQVAAETRAQSDKDRRTEKTKPRFPPTDGRREVSGRPFWPSVLSEEKAQHGKTAAFRREKRGRGGSSFNSAGNQQRPCRAVTLEPRSRQASWKEGGGSLDAGQKLGRARRNSAPRTRGCSPGGADLSDSPGKRTAKRNTFVVFKLGGWKSSPSWFTDSEQST